MMKKKVLGLALMAMVLVGFNGMAQNNSQKNPQCCKAQTECTKGSKGMKKEAREMKNPYEGLNLTDAQKSKLAELDNKRMADRKAKMEARKAPDFVNVSPKNHLRTEVQCVDVVS